MKLVILKEKLKLAIGNAGNIIQKNLSLPILENILLETEKSFLKLSATNLETGLKWWSLAKIEEEGKLCLPFKIISNLLSFFPEEKVKLEEKNLLLTLKNSSFETKIKCFSSADFPIIPGIKEKGVITLDGREFFLALSQILNIPSSSVGRPEISGILLSFSKNTVKLVATDSFRLAEKTIYLKDNLKNKFSLIVPQSAAKSAVNILGEREGDIKLYLAENQIMFEKMMEEADHPQIQFYSNLVSGEYPHYEDIVPKKFSLNIVLEKKDFLNKIRAASLFSGRISEVKLRIVPKEKKIIVLSENADIGEYKGVLSMMSEGKEEEFDISFNYKFLLDGISAIEGDRVLFKITNEEGPALLKPKEKDDYFYLIMPIKTA